MNYKEKVILITGASSGIGKAVAIALSYYNNHIIITARRKALLEEVCDSIRANGSTADFFTGDATDETHAAEVVKGIVKKYGKVDIALLNVGIGPPSNAVSATADKIKFCMRTNFESMINFYTHLRDQMKTQSDRCLIAHMNSQATWFGIPMQGDYTASKGAVRLFIDTARMEYKHFGIKHIALQTIHPGFVDTDAVRGDGIPAPNEISEEKAAAYVLKGFEKEMRENIFPFGTKMATKLGKVIPHWILTRVLLAETPAEY